MAAKTPTLPPFTFNDFNDWLVVFEIRKGCLKKALAEKSLDYFCAYFEWKF